MIDGNSEKMYRHFQVNTLGRKTFSDIGSCGISGCRHISSNILIYSLNLAKKLQYLLYLR